MRRIRIITDNSVQFNRSNSQDSDGYVTLPFNITILNSNPFPTDQPCFGDFPKSLLPDYSIKIVPPDMDDILNTVQPRTLISDDYLILSGSSCLPSIYPNAVRTVESMHGQTCIHVLDTLTIHAGLHYLVHEAAALAKNKADINVVESHIRGLIPHVYTILCIPNLSYLAALGIIDPAQARVGEMLEFLPVYSMEDGHLIFLDKFHKIQQVIDYFIDYISEFSTLKHISLIQVETPISLDLVRLFDYLRTKYSYTEISKYPPSIPLTAMFGPEVFGIIAIEHV
jgi:fatty acid-binding protein DegV